MSLAVALTFVKANPSRRRPPYFIEAPEDALDALHAAAKRDREIERRLYAFLRWLLGESRREDEVGPGNVAAFPSKLQRHAQRLMRWATRTDCSLTLLAYHRCLVRDEYLAHLAASPRGRRARRLARSLAEQHKQHGNGAPAPSRITLFTEYRERLLSPAIVRTLTQVSPQLVVAGDDLPEIDEKLRHGAVVVWLSHGCIITGIELATTATVGTREDPIYGRLDRDYVMGGSGAVWILIEDDGFLHEIRANDHLTVFNADETKVLWKGRIAPENKAPRTRKRSGLTQEEALGQTGGWTQKGFKPEEWARFFFQLDGAPVRGRLMRA